MTNTNGKTMYISNTKFLNSIRPTKHEKVVVHEKQGIDFALFERTVSSRHDLECLAVSMMADMQSYIYFSTLIEEKAAYEQTGEVTQFVAANLEEILSWSKDEARNMQLRYLSKTVRVATVINTKIREQTGEVFMPRIKRDDEGFWDLADSKKFCEEFENEYDAYHNPNNVEGYSFNDRDWFWLKKKLAKTSKQQ